MPQMRGLLWMTAGLVVAVIAGFVAFATLSGATDSGQTDESGSGSNEPVTEVVASIGLIGVRSLLTAEMLELREVPVSTVPEGAFTVIEEVVGKLTMTDIYPGEIILNQRLADPNHITGNGRTALILEEGQVLFALPPADLMSNIGVLKPGDRVDLLFSFNFTGNGGSKAELITFNLLQNVSLTALVGGAVPEGATSPVDPRALLLILDPQDVLVLKEVLDLGGKIDIVLRAPDDDEQYDVEPVDEEYIVNGWNIPR